MLPLTLQGVPVITDPWNTQQRSTQVKEVPSYLSSFEEGSLKAHNFYRARHGSSELTFSQMLSDSAKRWAEVLSRMKYIHHSCRNINGVRIGENIAVFFSNKPGILTGEEVTDQWYSEAEKYNFEQRGDTNLCGHFSQLVWRSSRQMGIGQVTTVAGHTIVVAHYYPPGNISGQYTTNVLPPADHNFSSPVIETSATISHKHSEGSPENLHSSSVKEIWLKRSHQLPTIVRSVPQTLAVFCKECLECHNKYRQQHNSPALHLSEQLSKLAQLWAETIVKESCLHYSNQLYKGERIGQNIFFKWTRQGDCLSGSELSDVWYSQVKNFDFSHRKHRMDTGHFTQMVWKNSKYIGIGKAVNSFGGTAMVVFYYPAGNIAEDFQDNVFQSNEKLL